MSPRAIRYSASPRADLRKRVYRIKKKVSLYKSLEYMRWTVAGRFVLELPFRENEPAIIFKFFKSLI